MAGIEDRVREFLKSGTWKAFPESAAMDVTFNDRIDALKAQRMARGEKKHGPLNLDTDPRNFIEEGIEELIDFLNYIEFAMWRGDLSFCKWGAIDRDVRFLIWRLKREKEREPKNPANCTEDLQGK